MFSSCCAWVFFYRNLLSHLFPLWQHWLKYSLQQFCMIFSLSRTIFCINGHFLVETTVNGFLYIKPGISALCNFYEHWSSFCPFSYTFESFFVFRYFVFFLGRKRLFQSVGYETQNDFPFVRTFFGNRKHNFNAVLGTR